MITSTLLSQLAESIERTKVFLSSGDKLRHIEEDLKFHAMIAAASGNGEYCRIFQNIQQKSLICRYKTYHLSGSTAPVSHGRIYMALQMKDRAQAMLAMQEHIRYVRDCLLDELETTEVPVDQPVAPYS